MGNRVGRFAVYLSAGNDTALNYLEKLTYDPLVH